MMSESVTNPFINASESLTSIDRCTLSLDHFDEATVQDDQLHAISVQDSAPYAPTVNDIPLIADDHRNESNFFANAYDMGDIHYKLNTFRDWGISTFKCAKQAVYEHLGKTQRTVDPELESKIDDLKSLQKKYLQLLHLSRGFASYFHKMTEMQRKLIDCMTDLSVKETALREEFASNSEAQKKITKNATILESALSFFLSSLQTMCEKSIEDTLNTARQCELARLQYDSYRGDLSEIQRQQQQHGTGIQADLQEKLYKIEQNCTTHRLKYEQLRHDVQVKLRFLDENRLKVMRKQLLLFHNAICAYFSGNGSALDASLRQFGVLVEHDEQQQQQQQRQ